MSRALLLLTLAEGFAIIGLLWAMSLDFIDSQSAFAVLVVLSIAFTIPLLMAYRDERNEQDELNG